MTDRSTDTVAPTRERIRKAGESYVGPLTDQNTKRAYSRAMPALDLLKQRGTITISQYEAGERLRNFMDGMRRPIGLVASYGDPKGASTPASQAIDVTRMDFDWPVYCRQKVIDAGSRVMNSISLLAWDLILLVLENDSTVKEAAQQLRADPRTCREHLIRGLECLAASDYAQCNQGA